MTGPADTTASWTLRIAAVAVTLVAVVAVFAFRFSANGNEVQAIMMAAVPVLCALAVSYVAGLVKKFSGGVYRWKAYLYTVLAVAAYLIIRTLL